MERNFQDVVFDWTQPNGKSVRLSRDDMAELQTIASETLGMERGVSSDRKHLCLQHYFHLPMLWGRDGKAPDYFVLVGGLLTK